MAASSTVPLFGQNADITVGAGVTGIAITQATPRYDRRIADITGSRIVSGVWTGDPAYTRKWIHGVPVQEWLVRGYIERDANCIQSTAIGSSITLTHGSAQLLLHTGNWRLRKFWPLDEITASSEAEWVNQRPLWSLGISAWGNSTGPTSTATEQKVSMVYDDVGTVAWATDHTGASTNDGDLGKISGFGLSIPNRAGGGIPVQVSMLMHGALSYTATNNDLSWLFVNSGSSDNPPKTTWQVDFDGGSAESISQSVLWHDFTIFTNKSTGGANQFVARLRVDKA